MQDIFFLDFGRLMFFTIVLIVYSLLCVKSKKPLFYSFVFLLILLPFNITLQQPNYSTYIQGLSSNYIVPTLSIIDIFVFLVILFSFRKKILEKKVKVFFALFFLFVTTKAFLDNNLLSTLLLYRIFFYSLAVTYLFKNFSSKEFLKTAPFIFFISILIQLVIGLFQFQLGHSLGLHFLGESNLVKGMFGTSFVELNEVLFLRAYGTFPHPNVLAGFSLFVLFFSIANFKKSKINIATSILATILIFFTFSRIIILLSLLFWVGFLFYEVRKSFFSNKGLKNISIFPLFSTRFANLFFENDGSYSDRLSLFEVSKEIFKNHPYLGIGAGRFVYGIDYHPIYTSGGFMLLQPVHNVFLLLLTEHGIFFGMPFIFLIMFFLLRSFFYGGLFIKYAVFSVLVIASFDHYFLTLPQGLLIFLFVLMSLIACSDKKFMPKS